MANHAILIVGWHPYKVSYNSVLIQEIENFPVGGG